MGKAELEQKKKVMKVYWSSFERYFKELEILSTKLSRIDNFSSYSTSLKPEIDKILFILTDLLYESRKIKEDKTIKKFLFNEFSSMVNSRNKVEQLKKEIESKIPKPNAQPLG